MSDAGREIADEDRPPALEWESPVWELFRLIGTQWRAGFTGLTGLDYNPAIALMQASGWDIELGIGLLRCVEIEYLKENA